MHSYLLMNEDMPWCLPCQFLDTVKHISTYYIHLGNTGLNCYNIYKMKDLLTENISAIINYSREVDSFFSIFCLVKDNLVVWVYFDVVAIYCVF